MYVQRRANLDSVSTLTEAISYVVSNLKTKEHSNKKINYILELWDTKFAIRTKLFLIIEKIHDTLIMGAKLI